MLSQETTDPGESAVWLAQDQVIGQTENHKTSSSKPSISAAVSQGRGEMRGAIGLDDEASLLAEEINDKWSDGMLASEFGAHDPPAAQHLPKQALCWRRAASQVTRHGGRRSWQPGHACLSATRDGWLLVDDSSGSPLRPGEGLGVRLTFRTSNTRCGLVRVRWVETALLLSQSANHEADHRDVDDGLARGRQVLVVLAEPALPPEPAEGALDNPSTRQNFEPSDIVGSLDDFHFQPVSTP